jgi:glycosyltransferase involved in cell wall biosynthesis
MDIILTYSEHTKQDAVATLGIDAEIIRVTPLAAHEQFRPLEDQHQVRAVLEKHGLTKHPYVLNIGTLEPRKNITRLLEAFHRLKQQDYALEHELVLVGAKGDLHEAIWETLHRLQLEAQVRWLGHVPFEDLPALLNGADLFVYPSLYEGFGLPPLEALSCGTPVVASSSTSLPEVVGDAGVLVDPLSVEQLAEAMRRVLTDAPLRAALRDKALRRAQTFSWEKTARLTLAAYEEAWARSRERRRTRRAGRNVQTLSRQQMRQAIITHLANQARQRMHA